jgi:tetratricopeptide (TPR) repeat protein
VPIRDITVQHAPFFEFLAEVGDDTTSDWRRASAGLVCLRLVDYLLANGDTPRVDDLRATRAAWACLESLATGDAVGSVLASLLNVLASDSGDRVVTARPRLMAYGRVLELESRWALAADVYETVIRLCPASKHADGHGDAHDAAAAYLRLGECRRQQARWEESQGAFRAAAESAASVSDWSTQIKARCLGAAVLSESGNLAVADALLRRAAQDARWAGLRDEFALALHGRAHVAFQRKRFDAAVRFAFRALRGLRDPLARDRALADVAAAFIELGVRHAARDASLILIATTQEPYVRGAALINLMDMAAKDRTEPLFEQYRRQLAIEQLPPRLAAYYHYYAGWGAWHFGRIETARMEYGRAAEISTRHGLAQLGFEIDDAIARLRTAPPVGPEPAHEPPAKTLVVARALGKMREELETAST